MGWIGLGWVGPDLTQPTNGGHHGHQHEHRPITRRLEKAINKPWRIMLFLPVLEPNPTQPKSSQPNPTKPKSSQPKPNSTQPKSTQPNPTPIITSQPNPTQPNPTQNLFGVSENGKSDQQALLNAPLEAEYSPTKPNLQLKHNPTPTPTPTPRVRR